MSPEEETLRALDDLVHQDKVLYIGASSYTAYRLTDSLCTSRIQHLEHIVSLQMQYSLVMRNLEREPLCRKFRFGIIPWFPVRRGVSQRRVPQGPGHPGRGHAGKSGRSGTRATTSNATGASSTQCARARRAQHHRDRSVARAAAHRAHPALVDVQRVRLVAG